MQLCRGVADIRKPLALHEVVKVFRFGLLFGNDFLLFADNGRFFGNLAFLRFKHFRLLPHRDQRCLEQSSCCIVRCGKICIEEQVIVIDVAARFADCGQDFRCDPLLECLCRRELAGKNKGV